MAKVGWTGLESAGKSQLMAVYAVKVFHRNLKWKEKRKKLGLPCVPRTMAFDSPMSEAFIKRVERAGMKYIHFKNLSDIFPITEMDIFVHEIIRWFPARGSEPLVPEQAEFLSQGSKEGINIYFCRQDFSQVHKHFRFLVNDLYLVTKIIGSERPCKSMPPIKRIWGIVLYWPLDPRSFKGDNTETERLTWWPHIYFINRDDTELYDTSYKVRGINLPPVTMVPQTYIYLHEDGTEIKREVKYQKR